jgi:biotin transport system substrate-specific component
LRITEWLENPGKVNSALLALNFALLTAIGAKVRVYTPFTPVPFTLQTAFVLSAGMYLGRRWGVVSMCIYLLLGVVGLPIFAGDAAGLSYFLGYTGGYLLGFLVAPYITAWVSRRMRMSTAGCYLASLAGTLVILALGTVWLAVLMGNVWTAICAGFLPFVLWEACKALVPTLLAKSVLVKK